MNSPALFNLYFIGNINKIMATLLPNPQVKTFWSEKKMIASN